MIQPVFAVDSRNHLCYTMITGVNSEMKKRELDELYALLRNMEEKKAPWLNGLFRPPCWRRCSSEHTICCAGKSAQDCSTHSGWCCSCGCCCRFLSGKPPSAWQIFCRRLNRPLSCRRNPPPRRPRRRPVHQNRLRPQRRCRCPHSRCSVRHPCLRRRKRAAQNRKNLRRSPPFPCGRYSCLYGPPARLCWGCGSYSAISGTVGSCGRAFCARSRRRRAVRLSG